VTERILQILEAAFASNKAALLKDAWDTGGIDPKRHGMIGAQQDLIEGMKEAKADEWNQWADEFLGN
jgi:hypothetical protein